MAAKNTDGTKIIIMLYSSKFCYYKHSITMIVNNTIVSFESSNNFDEDKIECYIVCSYRLSPVLIII